MLLKQKKILFLFSFLIFTYLLFNLFFTQYEITRSAYAASEEVFECRLLLSNNELFSAHTCFNNAVLADPDDQEANLFLAVTRILVLINNNTLNDFLDRAGVAEEGRDIYNWTADLQRNEDGDEIIPENSPTSNEIFAFLKTVFLPEVEGALNNLDVIEDSFNIILNPSEIAYDEQIEVDYGDVVLFKAALHAVKAWFKILEAYNLEIDIDEIYTKIQDGTFSINTDLLDVYSELLKLEAGMLNHSGDLDSDLDADGIDLAKFASAFGSASGSPLYKYEADFDNNGCVNKTDLAIFVNKFGKIDVSASGEAKSSVLAAINNYFEASSFIRNEKDTQENDLFFFDPEKLEDEGKFKNLLADIEISLTGPNLIGEEGAEDSFILDLDLFFRDPLNLRNYLPDFMDDNRITRCSFPDPTFNFVLPNFDQDDWIHLLDLPVPVSNRIACENWDEGAIYLVSSKYLWQTEFFFDTWCKIKTIPLSQPGEYYNFFKSEENINFYAYWDRDGDMRLGPGDYFGLYANNPINIISDSCSDPDIEVNIDISTQMTGFKGKITINGEPIADDVYVSIYLMFEKCWNGMYYDTYLDIDQNGNYVCNFSSEDSVYFYIDIWADGSSYYGWWNGSGFTTDCNDAILVTLGAGDTIIDINL